MEHVQHHRYIDLATPAKDDASVELKSRREFMRRLGCAAFAASASPAAFAQAMDRYHPDAPPVRYPEPDVMSLDKRFKYKIGNTPIVRLYRGTLWAEGPAWNGAGRYLVWSDIPNDEILRWAEEDGHVGRRVRFPSNNAPGQKAEVPYEPAKPDGLCFSPDFKNVYVADTAITHYPNAKSGIWVYDVDGQRLKNPRLFARAEYKGKTGFADGIRCDEDGNVWAGMGWAGEGYDGVHCYHPDGTRIGVIRMPEIISNVCFGGAKRNRLFMTGSQSLYAVYVETRGGTLT